MSKSGPAVELAPSVPPHGGSCIDTLQHQRGRHESSHLRDAPAQMPSTCTDAQRPLEASYILVAKVVTYSGTAVNWTIITGLAEMSAIPL